MILLFVPVPVTAGCFEPFPEGSNVSDETLERFRPMYSKELGGIVMNNPSSPVSFRAFQFYPLLDIEQTHSAEFGTNGHGPVNLTSRQFVSKEGVDNTCDASFDTCVNHCRIIEQPPSGGRKFIWSYMLMIPAWLAVLTSAKDCCFFRFNRKDVICVDVDSCRTRFIIYYQFAFHSDEGNIFDDMINDEAQIMLVVDHNVNSDTWSMYTKILSGFNKALE